MSFLIPSEAELLEILHTANKPVQNLAWLAKCIDHTLLKPEATQEQHKKLCEEALKYNFATVCVYPKFLPLCAHELKNSSVMPIAVIGFPTGNIPTAQKTKETLEAISLGAKEIDMVIQVESLIAKNYSHVFSDIQSVVSAAKEIPVKVILETCLLSQEEKISACALAKAAGAKFVKTSTGFSKSGATVEDVKLMRKIVGPHFGVKASGGVRTFKDAMEMILAGATRIGTSAGVEILSGHALPKSQNDKY